ncbi:MAG: short-chain dehydrogenase/reductase [Frankiales bacterium]|nr:short-chain dehydrogenase/reductase [Frankiales bacterium]
MAPDAPVVVVTGAARGIGRSTAKAYARRGARLVLVARSTAEHPNRRLPGTLDAVAEELTALGADVLVVPTDLSRPESADEVVSATLDRFAECDVLVNNAAVSFLGPFADVPVSKWRAALDVNLLAPVGLTHGFLPGMLARGRGMILNISSGAAFQPVPAQLPYAVSKVGLEHFTAGLALQLDGSPVRVACVRVDEIVPTEAVTYARPDMAELGRCSSDQLGAALVWVSEQPAQQGRIWTMADLRDAGAIPDRTADAAP